MRKKFSHIFLAFFVLTFIAAPLWAELPRTKGKFVLVLDAGHGGKDPGALGKFSKEKNINLNVTLEVGRLIEANCPDVQVIYTRKTDVFISLNRRAEIANNAKADLFISIHTNSLPGRRTAYGTETYTLGMARAEENLEVAKRENSVILIEDNYMERYAGFNPRSSESYIMFEFMQDQYMKQSVGLARLIQTQYTRTAGRKDKGVHQSGLLVLRETSMPSVLTELGFISTPEEERYLNSQKGIQQLAQSIYQGFVNYKKSQDGIAKPAPASVGQTATPRDNQQQEDEKQETPQGPDVVVKIKKDSAKSASLPKPKQADEPVADKNQTAEPDDKAAPEKKENETEMADERPVFRIQLLVSNRNLRPDDKQFKGLSPIYTYVENNMHKFTYGETTDYAEITRLRKSILDKFPKAFVVAFRNGERMNLQEAIKASKKRP